MKLYVVGLGPGAPEQMTNRAAAALEKSDVIVGYTGYVEQIAPFYPEKKQISTPMRGERERCRVAVEEAAGGKTVSIVCSGDAGVYGMASPVLEAASVYPDLEVEVVPGVTAACSGAALLGAPLSHDFAVISLSDLLTPWELIEKRLACAAEADFSICLYNPSSKKRADYLQKACEILLQFRSPNTPAGVVRNIGRKGETAAHMTLEELQRYQADMFTTVFIGNSQTKIIQGKLVTPRGYREEA